MSDDDPGGDTDEPGVADSDPRHIDPAGDLADTVERDATDIVRQA